MTFSVLAASYSMVRLAVFECLDAHPCSAEWSAGAESPTSLLYSYSILLNRPRYTVSQIPNNAPTRISHASVRLCFISSIMTSSRKVTSSIIIKMSKSLA